MSNQGSQPNRRRTRPPAPPLTLPIPTNANAQQVGWPTGAPVHTQSHNNSGAAYPRQNTGGGSSSTQGFQPGHRSFVPSMDSGTFVLPHPSSQQGAPPFAASGQPQRGHSAGDDSFLSFSRRNSEESSRSVPVYPPNIPSGSSGSHPVPSSVHTVGHGANPVSSSSRGVLRHTGRRGSESFINFGGSSGSESGGSPRSSTSSYRTAPESATSPTSPNFSQPSQSSGSGTAAHASTSGTPATSRSKGKKKQT